MATGPLFAHDGRLSAHRFGRMHALFNCVRFKIFQFAEGECAFVRGL